MGTEIKLNRSDILQKAMAVDNAAKSVKPEKLDTGISSVSDVMDLFVELYEKYTGIAEQYTEILSRDLMAIIDSVDLMEEEDGLLGDSYGGLQYYYR